MNTSVKVNSIMRKRSETSPLVFCNLPLPNKRQTAVDFLEYIDVLCSDLRRVILVKGSGFEVVTSAV